MSVARAPLTANLTVAITFMSLVEIMLTLAPNSFVTHSSAPSGVIAIRRGRLPTAMFFTILRVAVSITCTMLATSDVT